MNSYTTGPQLLPSVAASSNGDFVVVWNSFFQDGDIVNVFGQRYASNGSALGTEFQVNTYTSGRQLGPDVAADTAGNFVVVWGSEYQDGDDYGVFGQRYNSSGRAAGTEFQVNTYTTYFQSYFVSTDNPPRVAMDGSGDFVVVWSSYYQDGYQTGVFGRSYSSSGSALGTEFQVNTYTTDNQGFPAVGADANGNFVVAWMSEYQQYDSEGVFGERYDKSPGPATATPTVTLTPTVTPTPTATSPVAACAATPLSGCDAPTKSILLIADKDENGAGPSDKLIWKFLKGPATMQSEFGDPTSTAAYHFCVNNGASPTLVMEANVPAAGMCDGAPCWQPISDKGYKRKDKSATTDGNTQILLKGGPATKIIVKGKDGNLDLDASTLPLDDMTAVVAQLSNSDNANCWQATFPSAGIKKNTESQLKAKIP